MINERERHWPAAKEIIRWLRDDGMTYDAIAKWLMDNKVETVTGKTVWGVGQVWKIYKELP